MKNALVFFLFSITLGCQTDRSEPSSSDPHTSIRHIENLRLDAQKACQDNRVLTVLISREDCPWCDKLKKQVLLPNIKNGIFNDLWQLGELRIDEGVSVVDFTGKQVKASQLAKSWQAELTPTVLFLSTRGEEIAPRITGLKLVDFYDDYLQRSLRYGLENPERCT